MKVARPKVTTERFSMDRKPDGKCKLSVAARRVTTEKAPLPDFSETRKDSSGLLAVPPVNVESEKKRRLRDRLFLLLAFLLPFCSIMVIRILMTNSGEVGYDAMYHAGIAKLGPSAILAKEFPWLDSSVWKTAFADKEMLYKNDRI